MLALTNNVTAWPWWLQVVGAIAIAWTAALIWSTRPSSLRKKLRCARSDGEYDFRRTQRADRRAEDLLWAINRQDVYELAVDICLERAGGNVAVELVRTARSQRARAHLQVVA